MNRLISVILGIIAVLALIIVIVALTTDGELIVWRFVVLCIAGLLAAWGAVKFWRRSPTDRV